tara:strand:+ start:730 stop:921 length:192 start_codon:yes stop_codon:yes gene_type:complete
VKIETEISETLFKAMKDFIELNPEADQYSFIKSALNNFLYKNGCDDRRVAEKYLDDIFEKSTS